MPKANSDEVDVPVVCASCLGDDKNIRMTRDVRGEECKLCSRPFPVFRWQPVKGARRNYTKICKTCSRRKGACQCCMLDLSYGLSLAVRDAALKVAVSGTTAVSQKYIADNFDHSADDPTKRAHEVLKKLAAPSASVPTSSASSGSVPTSSASAAASAPTSTASASAVIASLPFNASIRDEHNDSNSLFIMGIDPDVNVDHLRSSLNGLGTLHRLKFTRKGRVGFVEYATEQDAERAAGRLRTENGYLVVDGTRMKLVWGKPVDFGDEKTQIAIGHITRRFLRTGKLPESLSGAKPSESQSKDDYDN